MKRIDIALALLCIAGVCEAQVGAAPPLPVGAGTDADVRNKHADPAAVEIPLYAGAPVSEVLQALSDKGFLIKWDKKQVPPTMKLLEKPKATRIDSLLTEILAPWGMRADRNQFDGGFRVRPLKKVKKDEPAAPGAT
jgi:hypothetical protein